MIFKSGRAALLLLIPMAGVAQVNLTFQDGETGRVPTGWEIPKSVSGAAEKRTAGCKSAACAVVDRSMVQKFAAIPYRGATLIVRASLRVEGTDPAGGAQLLLRTDGPGGMRLVSSGEDAIGPEWKQTEIVAEIDPDAESIILGVTTFGKSRVWLDGLTYEVVPPVPQDTSAPLPIRQAYARIDSAYGQGTLDSIAPLLTPLNRSSNLPFESRISGFRRLLDDGIHLRTSTTIPRVRALSDTYAVMDTRVELTRYSKDRSYSYRVVYRDLWTRTPQGWLLRDRPPLSFNFLEDSSVPAVPAPGKPSLFSVPAVNQAVPCNLATGLGPSLGATDYRVYLLPIGPLSALVVFVDFPDAPHSEDSEQLYTSLIPESVRWIAEVSNGKASLKVSAMHQWRRMPKPSTDYQWRKPTHAGFRTYIHEALENVASPLSHYDIIYIVAAAGGDIGRTVAFRDTLASGEARQVVMVGSDTRYAFPNYGAHVLLHATGNLFGLPDLYQYGSASPAGLVGGWDNMSLPSGAHFTAWSKAKLGWISQDQIQCVPSGSVTAILTPVERPEGLKALAIPVDVSTAYVAEAREWIGADSKLCNEGLLIYKVDTLLRNGSIPMRVIGGTRGATDEATGRCGPAYDATFGMQPGKPTLFEDLAAGVSIELLESSLGSYTVKATKGLVSRGESISISRASVFWSGPHPEPFTVAVTGSEGLHGALTVSASKDAPWLSISADNNTVPATLTISAQAKDLSPGVYRGTINISAVGASNSPRQITASITIP